jgi:hypothetical protein
MNERIAFHSKVVLGALAAAANEAGMSGYDEVLGAAVAVVALAAMTLADMDPVVAARVKAAASELAAHAWNGPDKESAS